MPTPTPIPTPTPSPTPPVTPTPTPSGPATPYAITDFTGQTDWSNYWGSVTVDANGFLHLAATSSTSGASISLNGSANWSDYVVSATIDWDAGQTISLNGDYADGNDYAHCYFDRIANDTVAIDLDQTINGNQVELAKGMVGNVAALLGGDFSLGMSLNGPIMTCSLGSHTVSSQGTGYTLNPPYEGQVGISVWDPTNGTAAITIKKISIQKAVNPQ
jgi:hypothetical protein